MEMIWEENLFVLNLKCPMMSAILVEERERNGESNIEKRSFGYVIKFCASDENGSSVCSTDAEKMT